jgi:hypothetical protein
MVRTWSYPGLLPLWIWKLGTDFEDEFSDRIGGLLMRKIRYFGAVAAVGLFINAVVMPEQVAAVGLGKTCDGFAGIRCDKGLWCEHKPGSCRVADASGKCVKVPQLCPKIYKPVCGCNNRTYGNDCMRRAAKVQKKHDGPCKKKYYRPSKQYCR